MRRLVVAALLLTACAGAERESRANRPPGRPADPEALGRAVSTIERLDRLRSDLASTFDDPDARPDEATFLLVCRPVGVEARRIAEENGWAVEQRATRWRNPDHAADPESGTAIERFERSPDLEGIWLRTERDGIAGSRYFRRITLERPCLACHGEKDRRPDFVKERYPEDRAWGFEPGDVRGVYAVFVPDSTRPPPTR